MREVSRTHSTSVKTEGRSEPNKLNPHYIVGFVDGEGCFCISICKNKTSKRRMEVRALFEIELRHDDLPILKRIQKTLDCGQIYHLNYKRYGWRPHVKLKVGSAQELQEKIIPFFKKYPLQTAKAKQFKLFSQVVDMICKKQHLTYSGFKRATRLRDKMRQTNKKAKNYKNHIRNR